MRRATFEQLVHQAWKSIPKAFRDRFANVAIFVEDEPSPTELQASDVPPGYTLLGLYHGVPLSHRGWGYGMALPDTITLFQRPIEHAASSQSDIPQVIHETLRHELAHHLGMNEREVRAAEHGVRILPWVD